MKQINKRFGKWGLALAGTSIAIAGCTATPQQTTQQQTTQQPASNQPAPKVLSLTAAGATFPYPLYSKWFADYQKEAGVQINYQAVGSGAGVKQIKNKTVDFGASDAPVDDEELQTMPGKLLQLPTVAGAVAVAYNLPQLQKPLKLDGATLADIFLGKITQWNDPQIAALNSGVTLPAVPVVVGHRSDGSGTSFIFTSYLSAVSPVWKKNVGTGKSVSWPTGIGGKGNAGVAGVIKGSPGAIGYVELAYAHQNNLATAILKNKAGSFVEPSVEATTAAIDASATALKADVRAPIINADGEKSYPIAGLTYLLVYEETGNADKAQTLREFLNWSMEEGQTMAKELDYAPLPDSIKAINRQIIETVQ